MKTTSYLKTTILAMAIAGTSSSVFAATADMSISATIATTAQATIGNLTLGLSPAGVVSSGSDTASLCMYSSTGSVTVVPRGTHHTGTGSANLVNSAGVKLPYHLVVTGSGLYGSYNFVPNGQYGVQVTVDPSSDCNAATVDADNLFSIKFVPDNTGLITAGTYTDIVTFTVSGV